MSINKDIAKNTFIHLAGKFVGLVLGLLIVVILTRYLGQQGFGYYSTVVAYLMFWAILVDFGLSLTTVQMISDPSLDYNKTINNILSLRLILSIGFVLVASVLIWVFPYPLIVKLGVVIMVWAYFGLTFLQTLTGIFQHKLQVYKVTIAEVAGKFVGVGLIGLCALFHKSILYVFGALAIEGLIPFIILFLFTKQIVKVKWQIDLSLWKEILSRTWPIALSITFNLVYLRMDIIILSLVGTPAEVGLYGAAYRIVDVLTMLPAVFMGIILPVVAAYFVQKKDKELKELLQKSFDALIIFSLPIVFGAFVVGRQLMQLIAGDEFVVSGDILKVLIIASGGIFITSLFSYTVVGIKKQKTMMWGFLTAAIITLIGYIIFIPKYGYWGAAWMTVFSECLVMVWTIVIVYRTINFLPSLKTFLRTIPAALIMVLVINYLSDWFVLWVILIGAVVYFIVLYMLGGVKKEFILDIIKVKQDAGKTKNINH